MGSWKKLPKTQPSTANYPVRMSGFRIRVCGN